MKTQWNKYNLSKRQFLFCEEYIKTGVGWQAYMTVYKTAKPTAYSASLRLLSHPKINSYIRYRQKQLLETLNTDMYWLVDKLKTIVEDNGNDRIKALELIKNIIIPIPDNKNKEASDSQTTNITFKVVNDTD